MRRVVRPILVRLINNLDDAKSQENAWTGLLLACMTLPAAIAAYLVRAEPRWAALLCVVFMLGYVTIYARLVRHHWCSPLQFLFVKPVQQLQSRA